MKTMQAVGLLSLAAAALAGLGGCKSNQPVEQDRASTRRTVVVVIDTSMGKIKAELWPDAAPRTVENFLRYTDEKYYDGLIFHRVMPGFMIQGGGFTPDMHERDTHAAIVNEASSDRRNERGALAMARTGDVNSATAQFFINVVDNVAKGPRQGLDHVDNTAAGFGYCVFGRVIDGMDVVDKIVKVRTRSVGPNEDVPVEPILIKSVTREK